MALASLGLEPQRGRRAHAAGIVASNTAESRRAHLQYYNRVPGIEYHFEGLELHWKIIDETKYRQFWRSLGFQEPAIDRKIEQVRDHSLAVNYEMFYERLKECAKLFHRVFGIDRRSYRVPIYVTFESVLDAGAMILEDGTDAIAISLGHFNFERWFLLRQEYERIFPWFSLSHSSSGGQMTLTPDDFRNMQTCVEGLNVLARVIMGTVEAEAVQKAAYPAQFLTFFEQVVQDPEYRDEERRARSNWLSAEVFLLCHEIGHLNLGHLEEIRGWHASSPRDDAELALRVSRRRQMEHEADSYGFVHMVILMSHILDKEYRNKPLPELLYSADNDPNAARDYFLPVADLFTIFAVGQKAITLRADDLSMYPSNEERLRYLFDKEGTNPNKAFVESLMGVIDCVERIPVDF